jgi:hypothetical protein
MRSRSIFIMDIMVWSTQFGDENYAKATAAGSECFDPQNWGIKVSRRPLLIPCFLVLMLWSPHLGDQNDAKARAAGSECFDPQHCGIKVSRRPLLISWSCGSNALIPIIRGSKWCESHNCGIRMFWSPALGDQCVAQATFDPMILWISWYDHHNWGIKMTRRPQWLDQNVLIPSIGGSKLRDIQTYGISLIFDPRLSGTYLETNIFELRVHPDSWNIPIASTLYGFQVCGNSFGI